MQKPPPVSRRTTSSGNALDAGEFSTWLRRFQEALRDGSDNDVACGDCVGCCSSSYFIHVAPDERETLGRIPAEAFVPAPGGPAGHVMMGCTPEGRCPMLADDRRCTIYAHRPRTCRTYDCRIFAAAGIPAGGPDKSVINDRVKSWRFSYASAADREIHRAVRRAAAFVRNHAKLFPGGRIPTDPAQLAILALRVHPVFLEPSSKIRSDAELARAIVERSRGTD